MRATLFSAGVAWLTWRDLALNESGFQIERRIGPEGPSILVGTTGRDTVLFSDAGFPAGSTPTYRVRVFNSTHLSAYSPEGVASAQASAGFGISGSVRWPEGRLDLSWPSVSNRSYTVFVSTRLAGQFQILNHRVPATPPSNVVGVPFTGTGARFFQVLEEP